MESAQSEQTTASGLRVSQSACRNAVLFRTPRSRRITGVRSFFRRTPTRQEEARLDHSEDIIVNKTWKLYRLSPLYKFSHKASDLRRYGTCLASFIAIERAKGFDFESDKVDKAIFNMNKGIKVSSVDPEAIQIVISGKSKPESESSTVLLTAVLCGVDMEENPINENSDNFTFYPIMLMKSAVKLSQFFITWMERQFDCRITPFKLSPHQLSWMVAMWSGLASDSTNKPIKLVYSVPPEVEGLKQITYSIDPHDCKELWESIHDKSKTMFTEEEVSKFMSSIETHFFNCFFIRISAMPLTSTGTPVAYCDGSGKIKIFSHKHVTAVLRYLTELSLEQFIQI
ncbi:centromere protein L-like [Gigantopelta aegis]|uniref:centromere protein L-like n=1 Tax=Gigantopelta aegis TaxID=1735272 RepID=UPI001B8884DA|nr:centromere protein L-like [Gigantopelta aegis]XP_041375664.1 centromere protein L-like [Gigantopelta aegis]